MALDKPKLEDVNLIRRDLRELSAKADELRGPL